MRQGFTRAEGRNWAVDIVVRGKRAPCMVGSFLTKEGGVWVVPAQAGGVGLGCEWDGPTGRGIRLQ